MAPLVAALEAGHDFETDVRHLTVFGRCGACRKAEAPAAEAAGSPSGTYDYLSFYSVLSNMAWSLWGYQPDATTVLLEAGSIVNREEELLLDSPERQALIATAVTDAAEAFCAARSPRNAVRPRRPSV